MNGVAQAFEYVQSHGLAGVSQYVDGDGGCPLQRQPIKAKLTSYMNLPANDEDKLEEAVKQTPVTVSICADSKEFLYYSSGIIDTTAGCDDDGSANHDVLLVGYGSEKSSGKQYWIVQNSFGPKWGEHGFARILKGAAAGSSGTLNIASRPVMPLGAKAPYTLATYLGVSNFSAYAILFGFIASVFSVVFIFIMRNSVKVDLNRLPPPAAAADDDDTLVRYDATGTYQRVQSIEIEI